MEAEVFRLYNWPDEPVGYSFEICGSAESKARRDALILKYYPGRNQPSESDGDHSGLRRAM